MTNHEHVTDDIDLGWGHHGSCPVAAGELGHECICDELEREDELDNGPSPWNWYDTPPGRRV